jgi:hypothetical protein
VVVVVAVEVEELGGWKQLPLLVVVVVAVEVEELGGVVEPCLLGRRRRGKRRGRRAGVRRWG